MEKKFLNDYIGKKIAECNERIEFFSFRRCYRLKELECIKVQSYSELMRALEKFSNEKELEETLKKKSYEEHGDYKGLLEEGFVSLAEEKYVGKCVYFEIIALLNSISC